MVLKIKLNVLQTFTVNSECTCCALIILDGCLQGRWEHQHLPATSNPSSQEVAKLAGKISSMRPVCRTV